MACGSRLSTVPRCCQARTRLGRPFPPLARNLSLHRCHYDGICFQDSWGTSWAQGKFLVSKKTYVGSPLSFPLVVNSESKHETFTHIKFQWHFRKPLSEGRLMNQDMTKYSFLAQVCFWPANMKTICSVTGSCGL